MANHSNHITSTILAEYNEAYSTKLIPNTVVISFLLLVGLVGNPLIIYVYEFRLPRTDGRCYIGPLAFFDLGTIIFTSTLNISQNCMKFAFTGQFLCKIFHFFSYAFIHTSLFLWTVIAVQRYRKICKPFSWQMKRNRRKKLIFLCAGFSIVYFSPVLYFYGINENPSNQQERNITLYVCEQTKTDTFGLLLFQGIGQLISLINAICIICLYIQVFIRIYTVVRGTRNSRNASSKSNSVPVTIPTNVYSPSDGKTDQQSSKNHLKYTSCSETQKMEHTIAFTFMTILLIGLFSFVPSRTLLAYESTHPNFWKNWQHMSSSKLNILLFLRRSYSLNYSCNIFVYLFFDSLFRNEMKSWMGF